MSKLEEWNYLGYLLTFLEKGCVEFNEAVDRKRKLYNELLCDGYDEDFLCEPSIPIFSCGSIEELNHYFNIKN